ncbi:hypothetical protein [Parafrankia sp. FMc2]|uniref:hypothetical protein n=1 Tax=Parafrankia sp. FMc2 TaxID=3233196 RepID=UPI0034D43B05
MTPEVYGVDASHPTDIGALCDARGWSRARLVHELRRAGRRRSTELPGDDSLRRMIRQWNGGSRKLSPLYADLLGDVFGISFTEGQVAEKTTQEDPTYDALTERLSSAAAVDRELVDLLEGQTDSFRTLDRKLGARLLLSQTEGHLTTSAELLRYSLPGPFRPELASVVAEIAALAGWQALDLGDLQKAWDLHDTAKLAARESGDLAALGHVTAQQGYILLDADQPKAAVALMQHARMEVSGAIPETLASWLWAAEAEALAACGEERQARAALDMAAHHLPGPGGERLPYVFLDDVHLARWRGHTLARLGAAEAVEDLSSAVTRLDPSFTRAAAGLRCDLALALSVQGHVDAAKVEAAKADELARKTSSARQRARITRLLHA